MHIYKENLHEKNPKKIMIPHIIRTERDADGRPGILKYRVATMAMNEKLGISLSCCYFYLITKGIDFNIVSPLGDGYFGQGPCQITSI